MIHQSCVRKIPSEMEVAPRYTLLTLSLKDNSRSVFMVINGSRSVFLVPGWFFMFPGRFVIFQGSRFVFMFFMVSGLVFRIH